MGTLNLKFIGATLLFATIFLVSGFFINTTKVDAADTTPILVGCKALSGDIFDITTGKRCTNDTSPTIGCKALSGDLFDITTGKRCANDTRIGCKALSGDIFDITTGKRCTNDTRPAIVGCAALSGHLFDITTGKRCTNDTRIGCKALSGDIFDITTGKRCMNDTRPVIAYSLPKSSTNPIKKVNETPTQVVQGPEEAKPIIVSPVLSESELVKTPIEESTDSNLTASGEKASSILSRPMSVRTILLIIIIILAIGYGIYSLTKKDPTVVPTYGYGGQKDKNKEVIKPIITSSQAKTPNPQVSPFNTPPQPKPQTPPLSNPQVNTPTTNPNPQKPLNILNNSNNSQGGEPL